MLADGSVVVRGGRAGYMRPSRGSMPQPLDLNTHPARLTIPACVACHSLRAYETCEGGCRERRCELVGGDQLDELINVESDLRAGIETLISAVELLDGADPAPGELHSAYHAVQLAARDALHRARLHTSEWQLPTAAQPIVVWRCEDCGAVDAMQTCLGVCIWRSVDWVDVSVYAAERTLLSARLDFATQLLSLVRRLAFATPQAGAWQRSWDSLRLEASGLLHESSAAV